MWSLQINCLIIVLHLFAAVIFPINGTSQKSFTDKMRKEIEKTIAYETAIDYTLTPGFIIGIVDGKNSMVLSFGVRAVTSEDTISVDDVFELGSITKVFTASLLAEMDRLGQISIKDRFDSLLPEHYRNQDMAHGTILDLLTHTSGLPRYPRFGEEIALPLEYLPTYTLEELLDFYANFQPDVEERFLYSHTGYAMIEPALYSHTGMRYAELLQKYLIEKNALSSISLNSEMVTIPGYNIAMKEVDPVDFGVFNASGGLSSNMTDMLSYVRYALHDSPDMLWADHGQGLGKHLEIGLGWHIIHHKSFFPVYMHTGRSLGHTSFIGVVRETQTGVVILANSATGVDDLGLEILRMINKNWKRKK